MATANDELIRLFYTTKKDFSDDYCYAIDSDWWKTWLFLIDLKIENPDCYFSLPETLSNDRLISNHHQPESLEANERIFYALNTSLKYNQDYNLVNREIWKILVDKFQAKFPLVIFLLEKSLQPPEQTLSLSSQDEELLGNKFALLDLFQIRLQLEGKKKNSVQISVPLHIPFTSLLTFVRAELDPSFDHNSQIKIQNKVYAAKDILEKRLKELDLSLGSVITFCGKEDEKTQNLGLLDQENINFNRNQGENNGNDVGNRNVDTDVSSGNGDAMQQSTKSMSTSTISMRILMRKRGNFLDITNELGGFEEKEPDREHYNFFNNDLNLNLNIENFCDRKTLDSEKLKQKYLEVKTYERIRLEKKDPHEIKRNINKLIKVYNFRKMKLKQQNKL